MPHRLAPIFDAVVMTFVSFFLLITWTTIISVIPSVLAILYWMQRIRKQIQKEHNGSFKSWLKAFVKKN